MREKEERSPGIFYIAAGSSEGAVGADFLADVGERERDSGRIRKLNPTDFEGTTCSESSGGGCGEWGHARCTERAEWGTG